jgi:hypothetical protein
MFRQLSSTLLLVCCLAVTYYEAAGYSLAVLSWDNSHRESHDGSPGVELFQLDLDGHEVIGMARLRSELYVVCVMNETIFVFQDNKPYKRLRTIKVPQLFAGPFDLVADGVSDRLFLLEWRASADGGMRVWTVDPFAAHADVLVYAPYWTGTIALAADGHRVLGGQMWHGIKLVLYSKEAGQTDLDLPPGTVDPQHAIQAPDGTFYLTEGWKSGQPHRLDHVSATGTALLRRYGGTAPGSGTGKFNWPRYLAFTPSGKILVADYYNRRVLQFDEDLHDPVEVLSYSGNSGVGWPQRMITLCDSENGREHGQHGENDNRGHCRTLIGMAETPLDMSKH